MKEAEHGSDPSLYLKAADTFIEAAHRTGKRQVSALSTGHAAFCRAMHFFLKFRETGDSSFYSQAKIQLEAAIEGYNEAGLATAADWSEATMLLLDAHVYLIKAETETGPLSRAKLYHSAEKSLELALELCEKSGYEGRKAQIQLDLNRVRSKAEFASGLAEVLAAPAVGTAQVLLQVPPVEQAKGLDAFEQANIQAQLAAPSRADLGQVIHLQIDLFNTGKKAALLQKLENLIPTNFKLLNIPASYSVEGSSLIMHGRRLEPLQVESVRLSLRSEQPGEVSVEPRVTYVDEEGKTATRTVEPIYITVSKPEVFEFKTQAAQQVFDFLVDAFTDDYMSKRLYIEQSGWRSLTEIAQFTNVPRSGLYGREGRYGPSVYELLSRGLVETRIFSGHRGRGGEVMKVRVAYDKEPVKRYVDRGIMKPR